MRFNNNVKFYSEVAEHYDPEVGHYVGGEELVAELIANVTDLGTNRSAQLFGNVDTRAQVIRLACPVGAVWSYCTIDDSSTQYVQTTVRDPLKAHTLIVGERK
ncbi:hypothetical protein LFYK43_11030 [Ligilactobacillus salitolerans]|uniref:Uncharacterized protein n=1 Tax=Ligilactobacillus salitolerans TaxID=1808352 RepID=A0A401ISZ6_9LACO|nr:hypothetical protein [Ligilactobacillus salitolerans]GBG94644.1 hypothetical protein LFYK43_11030 [Ligilactobacillus salitolerans]